MDADLIHNVWTWSSDRHPLWDAWRDLPYRMAITRGLWDNGCYHASFSTTGFMEPKATAVTREPIARDKR